MSDTPSEMPVSEEEAWIEEEQVFEDVAAPSNGPLSDRQLEALYDSGTARIVTQRNDFLIPQLLESMKKQEYLNLTPAYQRRLRWDNKKRSKLIESLLMNIPIPPVFLFETDLAQYEVMDGQQRLSTIRAFFSNEFALSGLERWTDLNGRRWSQLPPRIQAGLDRRSISAIILLAETAPGREEAKEIRRLVFQRLNTGGVTLNPQEVRNCVYAGAFNNLLHELSRHHLFTKVWDIPPREKGERNRTSPELARNVIYRQMADHEIVLRFFTLIEPEKLVGSLKRSLDDCMTRNENITPPQIRIMKRDYLACLRIAHDIYRAGTFRLPPSPAAKQARRRHSKPLYDAVMVGIYRCLAGNAAAERKAIRLKLGNARSSIVRRTEEYLKDSTTYELLVGRANTKKTILARIELMETLFRKA